MKSSINTLIISPHADDAELSMGGTMKYLSEKSFSIDHLILSLGELAEIDPINNHGLRMLDLHQKFSELKIFILQN